VQKFLTGRKKRGKGENEGLKTKVVEQIKEKRSSQKGRRDSYANHQHHCLVRRKHDDHQANRSEANRKEKREERVQKIPERN
jgi:hypothetical protein